MDLSNAGLRERAYRWCGANQQTYSEWTVDELTTAFIALRDAAKREGAMEEAAKHADCCVAREEQLDAARAEQREALNRAWAKCVVMEAQAAEMIHMYAESENKFGLGHMAGVREHIKELRDLLASTLGR